MLPANWRRDGAVTGIGSDVDVGSRNQTPPSDTESDRDQPRYGTSRTPAKLIGKRASDNGRECDTDIAPDTIDGEPLAETGRSTTR